MGSIRTYPAKGKAAPPKPRLQLEIVNWAQGGEFPVDHWCDTEEAPLEEHLPQIATNLLVAGEILYRGHAIWDHKQLSERKAEQDEKIRQAEEKAAREAEAEQQPNVVSAAGFETWQDWVLAEATRPAPFAGGLPRLRQQRRGRPGASLPGNPPPLPRPRPVPRAPFLRR